MLKIIPVLLCLLVLPSVPVAAQQTSDPQLLRKRYESKVTGKAREYYVFLPRGYDDDPANTWPMIARATRSSTRG